MLTRAGLLPQQVPGARSLESLPDGARATSCEWFATKGMTGVVDDRCRPYCDLALLLRVDEPLTQFFAGEEIASVGFSELGFRSCRDRQDLDIRSGAVLGLCREPRIECFCVGLKSNLSQELPGAPVVDQ